MQALLLTLLSLAAAPIAPDTVIVCPDDFRIALEPWVDYRSGQGHRLAFVSGMQSPADIRAGIREAAKPGRLRYVLLVGDAPPNLGGETAARKYSVPTHFPKAKVNVRFGSEPEIATDNPYADLDDDQLPDVAVGRLTADSPNELSVMVRKILAYETSRDHGAWRRKINFVAGVGGFGKLIDTVLETATNKILTHDVPASYKATMTFANWRSPFCPDPRQFHATSLARLNEGCLFWIYIGHGHRRHLDQLRVPGGRFHILGSNDAAKMTSQRGLPIAVFLACYTAAFDDARDCLAEDMLRAKGGPVAIVGGSRVTMPYAMAVLSNAMLDEFFHGRQATLGDLMLAAKRRMVSPKKSDSQSTNRVLMDLIASVVSPNAGKLDDELREHLLLYNLLGDPLLRLPRPREIQVKMDSRIVAGEELEIAAECPLAGRCRVELVYRRDQLSFKRPNRDQFDQSSAALANYSDVYHRANDRDLVSRTLDATTGALRTSLRVPENVRGPCHVRLYVEGSNDCAMGSANVYVRRPRGQ